MDDEDDHDASAPAAVDNKRAKLLYCKENLLLIANLDTCHYFTRY